MAISSPSESVYYYECSGGSFRLAHFIPPNELERLRDRDRISPQAVEDFPDGVDLSCTEADFAEFERVYGYRPAPSPEGLCRAFFAILSATRDWQQFRGSGFIAAADLERRVEPVERELRERTIVPEAIERPRDGSSLEERRRSVTQRAIARSDVRETLERMPVEGIDPGQTLRDQKFSSIPMGKGARAEEVFAKLHQKRKS